MKKNNISIHQQYSMLKSIYKNSHGALNAAGFIWTCEVKPTEISDSYLIKIKYNIGKSPHTFVISPNPLPLADGAKKLPHTYNSSSQELCLYYPKYREWDSSMPIATTIVHWTIKWLFYYEIWRYTGIWNGGGHGDYNVPKS